jgi:cysteine sulfinate desulfinase/cysteine desulfurase-like protein
VRLSLGQENTLNEIQRTTDVLREAVEALS